MNYITKNGFLLVKNIPDVVAGFEVDTEIKKAEVIFGNDDYKSGTKIIYKCDYGSIDGMTILLEINVIATYE